MPETLFSGTEPPAPAGWERITGCDCQGCRPATPNDLPTMYASRTDDPAHACQCELCRATRAGGVTLVWDAAGYDQYGYDRYSYDRYGVSHQDRFGYDRNGYDRNGYDRDGYDRDGYDSDGYARMAGGGRDRDGYDRDGYDSDGYDRDGYDRDGYDSDGYDSDGFNSDHVDSAGDYPCGCAAPCGCWDCRQCRDEVEPDEYECGCATGCTCGDCEDCGGSSCQYDDCCTSPQQNFTVHNDGCEPLANDTRVTITLPAGAISADGLQAIRDYLRLQEGLRNLSYDLEYLGNEWQTRTGNYAKRLSRHAYKTHGVKLSQEVMSQVGNIARNHSTAVDVQIDVTRDLNQSPEAFYHDGSCWFTDYAGSSRCALKTNGGYGLRSFGTYSVSGRAWVMPLRQDENDELAPTFETQTPDAFVVFNGYGDLSGYTAPRIVAHMAGMTYRKVGFDCDPMYINAGGYIVAPEEIAKKYTDGSLSLSVQQHARLFDREQLAACV